MFSSACVRGPIGPDPLQATGLEKPLASIGPLHPNSIAGASRLHDFSLLGGMFLLTTDAGDTIAGTYTGEASVTIPGQDTASLQLTVSGGTGIFNGATGSLTGNGIGAFTGEGNFVLVLSGSLATTAQPVDIHVSVKGASVISCAPEERILLRLQGQGVAGRFGRLTTAFSHQVSNTSCGSS
jgi:hypothetical protein